MALQCFEASLIHDSAQYTEQPIHRIETFNLLLGAFDTDFSAPLFPAQAEVAMPTGALSMLSD